MIVRIGINIFNESHDACPLLIFCASEEENVSLHPVHVQSRYNLDIRIRFVCASEILLAVVFAYFHLYFFDGVIALADSCAILFEVTVARYEVVKFLKIFQREFYSVFSP